MTTTSKATETLTTATELTGDVFDRMYKDNRWLDYGYLGERRIALDDSDSGAPAQQCRVEATDQRIIKVATERGWSYDQLFDWANSRNGRHLADEMFGSSARFDIAWGRAVNDWRLL